MPDDLKPLFDRSLGSIPIPNQSVDQAQRRGRRIRTTHLAVDIGAALVIVVLGAVAANSLLTNDRPTKPVQPQVSPSDQETNVDKTASLLIEDLRPSLCRGVDFYFKAEIAGEPYRPVQCGAQFELLFPPATSSGSPSPTPPSASDIAIVRGPRIVIYAFTSDGAKQEWLGSHAPPWGGRIGGNEWVIDVMDRESFARVQKAISDHQESVVSEPTASWEVRNHVVTLPPGDLEPQISLKRASLEVRGPTSGPGEVLGAQLGMYSDRDDPAIEPVPAWIITVRQCIPAYGGEHASAECRGDQLYTVINADTGRHIVSFSN